LDGGSFENEPYPCFFAMAMPQKNELRLSKNTLRQSLKPMKYFPSILVTFLWQWEKVAQEKKHNTFQAFQSPRLKKQR